MRILHSVLTEGFYGSEHYCIELACEQARRGHDVQVLIYNPRSDCARAMQRYRAGVLAAGHRLGLIIIPSWLPPVGHRVFARQAIKRFAPDIVHTYLGPAARRVGAVGQRLGVPHVCTLVVAYNPPDHARCDGMMSIVGWQERDVPAAMREKVRLTGCWPSTGLTERLANLTADESETLRRAWRADRDTVVFGSVGRCAPEKGMDVLVRAFQSAFPGGNEPVRLVLVGDGPERSSVQQLAAADARITLAGTRYDLAPYYAAFDTFISAARFEPFGLVILEAMAAGLPLVLTRTQGPSEFVRDPRVLWAEPGDPASLSAALREAAATGRRRLAYDLSSFSLSRIAGEIERFYRDVIDRTRAR